MAEDLYKVLGLQRNATKDEIKESFRRLAIKFHPDKHAQSSNFAREEATRRFKQVSHAYDILNDDRKRAVYNIGYRTGSAAAAAGRHSNNTYYSYYQNSYHKNRHRAPPQSNYDGWVSRLDVALRFLTTRAFLLNVAFAGILLGGAVAIDRSGDTLWKMQNSGKSFEEAMKSVEKNKSRESE
ncbi:hypothetical protein V2J09_011241 [Rumex salicifolius]